MHEISHLKRRVLALALACVTLLSLLPVAAAAGGGQIALLTVTRNGLSFSPEYVEYASGDTVKDVLRRSGHTFEGIDSGFISAIDGKADNFSLYYDGGGYSLETPAEGVTAVWFTTNATQGYSDSLLNLVCAMTAYSAAENGVKDYAAAQKAYAAAVKGFYDATPAAADTLCAALTGAMQKYTEFLSGKTVSVAIRATLGGEEITPATATFTSEFGTVTTVTNASTVELVPATYTFDLSDGEFRHVRGTVTVTGDTTLSASLPAGQWIRSVELGIDSQWTQYGKMTRMEETAAGATYLVPDYATDGLYPYFVPDDSVDVTAVRVYPAGAETLSKNARSWESTTTVLFQSILGNSLQGADVVCEARLAAGDYEQYQTFTLHIVRTPSLSSMTVEDSTALLKLDYDKTNFTYTVSTTEDTVRITSTALCSDTVLSVAGQAAQSGQPVTVALADCAREGEEYLLPVTASAHGQTTTYTVRIIRRQGVSVSLTHDADVTVQVYNDADGEIYPKSSASGRDTYTLLPGGSYTYVATKDGYYHTTAAFTAESGAAVAVATPVTEDWLTNLAARNSNSKAAVDYSVSPAFQADVHEYDFTVESNSSGFYLLHSRAGGSYTVTALYTSHPNSNSGGKPCEKDLTGQNDSYAALTSFVAVGGYENTLRLRVAQTPTAVGVTYYQEYVLTAAREMTLNALSATDSNGAELPLTRSQTPEVTGFNKSVHDYTVSVGQGIASVDLALRPLSTYKQDADAILTVACGSWSQTITYGDGVSPAAMQTVTVPLQTQSAEAETITITVSHKNPATTAGQYTVNVAKLPAVQASIAVSPADATVFLVADANAQRVLPETDGTYTLSSGSAYTMTVTRSGYIGQQIRFIADESSRTLSVTLEKAADSTRTDISLPGDWTSFRADANNSGVVDYRTPTRAEDTVLVWANQLGEGYDQSALGCPILVGGAIYIYSGKHIFKVDKDTGLVLKTGEMADSSAFAITPPTYADGMIFVGLRDGRVQAFDAETLTSLWLYTDPLGGQPNCPITYADGYVYTGFWNSETSRTNFVCLSATDEDPSSPDESKLAAWTYTHNGFYWAGAYAGENFLLVPTDDGSANATSGHGELLSLDPKTGELLSSVTATGVGDLRSSICYDEATDAYYFTSKGGDLYQVRVTDDGMIREDTLRRLHLDNGSDDAAHPPMSTSTPVIHNGRAYIGVCGTSQFGAYSGHNITVVDLNSFTIAYRVPTMGYPQTSGLLTTAYESEDGFAYVYFVDNYTPGKVRVIRDKPGMTEVDHSYTSMETYLSDGQEITLETAYTLFTPSGEQAQYAICSPIADGEGNLYFKNDSAYLMRLSSRLTELEVTCLPQRMDYAPGDLFDGSGMTVQAHFANGTTRDITKLIGYSTDPLTLEDTEITLSVDWDKLVDNALSRAEDPEQKPVWALYQDREGQAGTPWDPPTISVDIRVTVTAGDLNGDGSIDVLDLLLLRRYLAGYDDPEFNGAAADVNLDGAVDLQDLTLLRKYLAGGYGMTLGSQDG